MVGTPNSRAAVRSKALRMKLLAQMPASIITSKARCIGSGVVSGSALAPAHTRPWARKFSR